MLPGAKCGPVLEDDVVNDFEAASLTGERERERWREEEGERGRRGRWRGRGERGRRGEAQSIRRRWNLNPLVGHWFS